jgi:hypothetical protein
VRGNGRTDPFIRLFLFFAGYSSLIEMLRN